MKRLKQGNKPGCNKTTDQPVQCCVKGNRPGSAVLCVKQCYMLPLTRERIRENVQALLQSVGHMGMRPQGADADRHSSVQSHSVERTDTPH